MALPKALRRRAPDAWRNGARLRPIALRAGLVPPRTMHSPSESALLRELAGGRRHALEIGVYEAPSALALIDALPQGARLDLVEPFGAGMDWWQPADERAVRALVSRAARRRGGPALRWHVTTSEEAAREWSEPLDLVFIDGDHSEPACRLDWRLWSRFVEPGGVVAFTTRVAGTLAPPRWWRSCSGATALRAGGSPPSRETIVAVERLEIR